MQRVVVVGVVLVLTACNACFEVDPPPKPPVPGTGVIAGKILVGQSGGASVVDPARVAALRDDVARARRASGGTVDDDARTVHVTGLGPRADHKRVDPQEKQFRAGDALVLFERRAFTKTTIGPALERVKRAAGLRDVVIRVDNCKARIICKLSLMNDKGFLDDDETTAAVTALRQAIKRAGVPGIKGFVENIRHEGFIVPNDPLGGLQWHYSAIKLPPAWDITVGDPDLVVAVVDSGVKHANPDLRDKIARDPDNANQFVEFDFVSTGDLELDDIAGIDLDAEDPGDNLFGSDPGEDSFHGTHVAGTIGAETDNRSGVAGILWEAQIVPVRVLGSRLQGNFDDIVNGVLWAIGDPDLDVGQPVNKRPARLVNLSLGAVDNDGSTTEFWTALVNEILDDPDGLIPNDIIMVAAAGNAAQDARATTPANVERMITVGATRFDGQRATYSNFGSPIDLMAPGGELTEDQDDDGNQDGVLSTWDVDVKQEQGTSMSAPHVTGVAGLLVSAKPSLTHDQVHDILKTTANATFVCNEGCGAGLVDAVQALIIAGAELDPRPRLSVDSERVVFPSGITRKTLRVLNLGNVAAPFSVTLADGDEGLFTVTPSEGTVVERGSVTLTIELARGAETEGAIDLVVTGSAEAADQVLRVELLFQDNPARPVRDLDVIEVAAYVRDAAGDLKLAGTTQALSSAGFVYEIAALKAGVYEVYAVGDDNHDGIFDSQQESFGAYPITDGVQPIILEDNDTRVDAIDFGIALRSTFTLEAGVGAPCDSDDDCGGIDFAPDAACIDTFPGGYCSRLCDDAICGVNGQCETLQCDGAPCDVCLQRCVADSQCRTGYLCDFGTCAPAGFGN